MHTADAIASDLQLKVRAMAATFGADVSIKVVWQTIAKMTRLTAGQIKRLYYGEWRVVPAHVFVAITDAYRSNLVRVAERSAQQAAEYQALAKQWDDMDEFMAALPSRQLATAASGTLDETRAPASEEV